MLKIASDVNHKQLGREFIVAMLKFFDMPYCNELLKQLCAESDFRPGFRDMVEQLRQGVISEGGGDVSVSQFRASKRGRKPSFARAEGVGTMHQVTYLGAIDIPKAS